MSNICTFVGRLGRDPELKRMTSGDAVLNFSLGSDVGYGDKKQTLWVRVAMFGKRAETLGQYLKKGSSVLVSGELKTREYTGNDGIAKTSLELTANVVDFVGGRQESSEPTQAPKQESFVSADDDFSDPIPF